MPDDGVREYMARMARRRWRGTKKAERSEQMGLLARSRWSEMTDEQRSAEMSRRRKKGLK